MHKCILCPNTESNEIPNVTYHPFPRNLVRRNLWVEHLKLDTCFDWQRICSEHFTKQDFRLGEKRLLRLKALPKLPANEIHENNGTLESQDINLVNNTANNFGSLRRSSRKIKKTRQLLENEKNKIVKRTTMIDTSDLSFESPISISSNQKLKKIKRSQPMTYFYCTVKSCKNSYPHSNVSFFTYPDSYLREVWMDICGSKDIFDAARGKKKHLKVCGKHFDKSMFINPKKKNRLKSNAVPSLHIDKVVCNTIQSATFVSNDMDMESTSVEESSSAEFLIQSTVEIDESTTNEADINTNTNVLEICCIPGCISNISLDNMKPGEYMLIFSPPMEDIKKWSTVLKMPLTKKSRVCERHFKSQDVTAENKLLPGAVPLGIDQLEDEVLLSDNDTNIYNSIDRSENQLKYVDSPKDEDHSSFKLNKISTNTLPQTIVNSSSYMSQSNLVHNEHTSVDNAIEIDTNTILNPLSETRTQPVDESISTIEKRLPKLITSNHSVPISNMFQSTPIHNKCTSVFNITEIDTNSVLKQSSEIIAEPICSTSSTDESISMIEKMLSNSSVSISVELNDGKNKQTLPVNSTEVINNTSFLKQTLVTEPTDILSNVSISSCTPSTSQSNLIQILPNTFTNGSVSISLTPSITQNTNLPENDSADILKPTSVADNFISNSIDSTFKDPILKNLVNNNSLSITREPSNKLRKPIPTMNSTSVFKSPNISIKTQSGPTDVKPTTSTLNFSLENNNLPELLSPDELAIPQDSSSKISVSQFGIEQTAMQIKLEPIDHYEIPITSTDNCMGMIDNLGQKTCIQDFAKTLAVPTIYWKSLYLKEQNSTMFIERNVFMETMKKIEFNNSLVPMIFINNKRYEYNEAINDKISLENLLDKIDKINICSGYDGLTHDQCIGYIDNTSGVSEVCSKCETLVLKDCFAQYEAESQDQLLTIKRLRNKMAASEHRISKLIERLQHNYKKSKNMFKSKNTVIY